MEVLHFRCIKKYSQAVTSWRVPASINSPFSLVKYKYIAFCYSNLPTQKGGACTFDHFDHHHEDLVPLLGILVLLLNGCTLSCRIFQGLTPRPLLRLCHQDQPPHPYPPPRKLSVWHCLHHCCRGDLILVCG